MAVKTTASNQIMKISAEFSYPGYSAVAGDGVYIVLPYFTVSFDSENFQKI